MISKTKVGRGFRGTLGYCLQECKNPEILDLNGLAHKDAKGLTHEFVAISSDNPNISKPVWHSALSFTNEDKITNEKMVEIANKFMEKAGFSKENNQWVIIKHNDTKHTHCHIVANRVGFDCKAVSDYYYKSRSVEYAKEIEREYGLVKVQELAKIRRQEQNIEGIIDPDKERLKKTLEKNLKQPRIDSFSKLEEALKAEGITMKVAYHSKTGEAYGVKFSIGDKAYKGSEIGKQFTFKSLNQKLSPLSQTLNIPLPSLKGINTAVKIISKGLEMNI